MEIVPINGSIILNVALSDHNTNRKKAESPSNLFWAHVQKWILMLKSYCDILRILGVAIYDIELVFPKYSRHWRLANTSITGNISCEDMWIFSIIAANTSIDTFSFLTTTFCFCYLGSGLTFSIVHFNNQFVKRVKILRPKWRRFGKRAVYKAGACVVFCLHSP